MNQLALLGTLGATVSIAPNPLPEDGERIKNDAYYTPDRLARAIVSVLPILSTHFVLEPHAGGGAFVRALLALTAAYIAVSDIDRDAAGLRWPRTGRRPILILPGADFLTDWSPGEGLIPDWIIGNPPFDAAEAHIRHALAISRQHVVMLLRASILHSLGRIAFWRDHPARHVWHLAGRPSFTGGGTDSADYAVVWWDKAHTDDTTLTACWDWHTAAQRASTPEPTETPCK